MTVAATLDEALALLRQQQAEIDRLQSTHEALMRVIAHDLRAPLRHVVSFAPLLRESVHELAQEAPQAQEVAQDAYEFAQTMESAARKMSDMLDGLSKVSRAARAPLNWELVDVSLLLDQVVQPFRQRHAAVQWVLPAQTTLLRADAELLRLALQVLVDNAVKFSARQVQPRVSVGIQPLPDGLCRLIVQDNGVGFDDTRANALGELFQRMHRESEFEGVGAGLALLQTVAERHGAQWQLKSQPQSGCTAWLDWPTAA